MRTRLALTAALVVAIAMVAAPAAHSRERLLTFYSPKINSQPYVHDTHEMVLRANGRQAPKVPGYITGWAAQDIVDSKKRNAGRFRCDG